MRELEGREFVATAITEDGHPYDLVAGTRLILWLGEDRLLGAEAGCNQMHARIRAIAAGRLELDEKSFSGTAAFCEFPNDQENWYFDLIEERPAIRVDGPRLVLATGSKRVEFLERVSDPKGDS